MNKRIIHHLCLIFLLAACGSGKEVTGTNQAGGRDKDKRYITQFHKAVRLKSSGRIDEAIAAFEECLRMKKDDDAVYYSLSQLQLIKNDELKASEYIIKAAEIDPNNIWYVQELAFMYFDMNDYPNAIKHFKTLVDKQPENIEWLYGYAEALRKNGDLQGAVGALDKTEGQIGLNPQLSIQKYQLYMQDKKEDLAIAELNKAREVFPMDAQLIAVLTDHYFQTGDITKAQEMLFELIKANPGNGRAMLALADLYQRQGKMDDSNKMLFGAFASLDVDIDTKMQILMSMQERTFKEDPNMNKLIEVMLETHPNEAKSHSINGDYLLKIGKDEEALLAYRKALEFDKNQYPIWNQVLVMEYQQGKDEWLYEDSKECLELFPTIATVYLLNGVGANLTGKHDEAIDVLSLGVELVLTDKPLEAEFYGQLGDAHFQLKSNSEGIENYKKAIEYDPSSLLLKNNFARRLANAEVNLDLAQSMAEQAVNKAHEAPIYIDNLGWVYFQQREYEKALEQFEAAYELLENDHEILEHLGDAEFMLGNKSKALHWWQLALELKSNDDVLKKKINDKKYYAPE